jgi:hypothetical protein
LEDVDIHTLEKTGAWPEEKKKQFIVLQSQFG